MADALSTVAYWNGVPVNELSREDLISALKQCADQIDSYHQLFVSQNARKALAFREVAQSAINLHSY